MRIAQIAPLAESVPPKLYGGTERVVAWLVDELVSLGHQVTLFASGDSRTRGELHPVWPRSLRLGRPAADPTVACTALLEAIAQRIEDFDVVHSHLDFHAFACASLVATPTVTTLHGRLDLPDLPRLYARFPTMPVISISDSQRTPLPQATWAGTVYNAVDTGLLEFNPRGGDYLAWIFAR